MIYRRGYVFLGVENMTYIINLQGGILCGLN